VAARQENHACSRSCGQHIFIDVFPMEQRIALAGDDHTSRTVVPTGPDKQATRVAAAQADRETWELVDLCTCQHYPCHLR
jgi:hypothetical protein